MIVFFVVIIQNIEPTIQSARLFLSDLEVASPLYYLVSVSVFAFALLWPAAMFTMVRALV